MHTVVQTSLFAKAAKRSGVTEEEITEIEVLIARNPKEGSVIQGTGGIRKVRFGGKGKGKSGGYRFLTFYSGKAMPVFLLSIYSKNQKIDISQDDKRILAQLTKAILESYKGKKRK